MAERQFPSLKKWRKFCQSCKRNSYELYMIFQFSGQALNNNILTSLMKSGSWSIVFVGNEVFGGQNKSTEDFRTLYFPVVYKKCRCKNTFFHKHSTYCIHNISNPLINYIAKKIKRSIGILSKLPCYLNSKTLLDLYYALVYPFLTYCLIAWGNTYQTSFQPLFVLQKKPLES